ncbi:MAG TPA: ABC transporter substrate-binding protein, partial [Acidimicrobiia bacterium]|nr:ABC transporter substrate-binding protein [Acidimicrobiia bacterium]
SAAAPVGSAGATPSKASKAPSAAGSAAGAGGKAAPSKADGGATSAAGSATPTPGGGIGGDAPAPVPGAPGADKAAPGVSPETGVSDKEIKFGSISFVNYPMGNILSIPVTTSVDATMRAVNDTGGVYGRRLRVIDCDDAGDITRFRACYKKLVEQEKIFAFTTSLSWGTGEVHPDLARDKIPWIASWGFFASEWKDPWMFPAHMASIHEAHANAEWVLKVIKPKTVGILHLNTPEQNLARKALREVLEPAGVKIVKEIPVEVSTPDESADVIAMRSANPDHIIHYAYPAPVAKFFIDAAQQGYWPPKGISGNHLAGEIVGPIIGDWPAKKGAWTNTTYNLWGTDYLATMRKYAPHLDGRHNHITQAGWVGVNIFTTVAKEIGPNLTREAVMKGLESRVWEVGGGLDQRFHWKPGGTDSHDTMRTEYMFKYESQETGPNEKGTSNGFVPDPDQFQIHDTFD